MTKPGKSELTQIVGHEKVNVRKISKVIKYGDFALQMMPKSFAKKMTNTFPLLYKHWLYKETSLIKSDMTLTRHAFLVTCHKMELLFADSTVCFLLRGRKIVCNCFWSSCLVLTKISSQCRRKWAQCRKRCWFIETHTVQTECFYTSSFDLSADFSWFSNRWTLNSNS